MVFDDTLFDVIAILIEVCKNYCFTSNSKIVCFVEVSWPSQQFFCLCGLRL